MVLKKTVIIAMIAASLFSGTQSVYAKEPSDISTEVVEISTSRNEKRIGPGYEETEDEEHKSPLDEIEASERPGNSTDSSTDTKNNRPTSPGEIRVASLSLNKSELTLHRGDSETLTCNITPVNATDKTLKWESSNTKTASVDSNGKVTANGVGQAVVSVISTNGSIVKTCIVTVEKAVPEYEIPVDIKATYGDKLGDIRLPNGFSWKNTSQTLTELGKQRFIAVYTPVDTINYDIVDNIAIEVEIEALGKVGTISVNIKNTDDSVELKTATEGADIYYTLDGSEPSIADNKYINPITLDKRDKDTEYTIKAIGFKQGYTESDVLTFTYLVEADTEKTTESETDSTLPYYSYSIMETPGRHWKPEDNIPLTFTANGDMSKFRGVKVDGITLTKDEYELKDDSFLINLKTEYLNKLDSGEHTITVDWEDKSAESTFIIYKEDTESIALTDKQEDKQTKGLSLALVFGIVAILALIVIIVFIIWRLSKDKYENWDDTLRFDDDDDSTDDSESNIDVEELKPRRVKTNTARQNRETADFNINTDELSTKIIRNLDADMANMDVADKLKGGEAELRRSVADINKNTSSVKNQDTRRLDSSTLDNEIDLLDLDEELSKTDNNNKDRR